MDVNQFLELYLLFGQFLPRGSSGDGIRTRLFSLLSTSFFARF